MWQSVEQVPCENPGGGAVGAPGPIREGFIEEVTLELSMKEGETGLWGKEA